MKIAAGIFFMNNIVVCLMGPTASGKTAVACELVQQFPCDIISVDSAMIYRGMDIGTAKPDTQTQALAPHHLIDICNPDDSYSAAQFCRDASRLCHDSLKKGRIPLLVGGTMMYFRALQDGLSMLPQANSLIRAQIEHEAAEKGWTFMHDKLSKIDPLISLKIHKNDAQRIQRALEVYALTGQPLSGYLEQPKTESDFSFINVILMPDERAWLHQRIGLRFQQMLQNGLIDEVAHLLQKWQLTTNHPALRCVGYRQVFDYLQGDYNKDVLLEKGSAATRQLAKRQLTWLRHWPDAHRVMIDQTTSAADISYIISRDLLALKQTLTS